MFFIMVLEGTWHPIESHGGKVLFLTSEEAEKYAAFWHKIHNNNCRHFVAIDEL